MKKFYVSSSVVNHDGTVLKKVHHNDLGPVEDSVKVLDELYNNVVELLGKDAIIESAIDGPLQWRYFISVGPEDNTTVEYVIVTVDY